VARGADLELIEILDAIGDRRGAAMARVALACPGPAGPLALVHTFGVRRDRARGRVRAGAWDVPDQMPRLLGDVPVGREHDGQRRVPAQSQRPPRQRFGQDAAQRRVHDRSNLGLLTGVLAHATVVPASPRSRHSVNVWLQAAEEILNPP